MDLTRRKSQILINQFNNINVNKQVYMDAPVLYYVLIPYEGKIHLGDTHGIRLYLFL